MELVAGVAFLLLPVVMLVTTLPTWAAREHAATVAAREGARVAVRDFASASIVEVAAAARLAAAGQGVPSTDVAVEVVALATSPGSTATVRVTVRMPVVDVPGIGRVGGWSYAATASRRVDDYRSV